MESNRQGKKQKKSKCCLYCNNAHCGKFLLLLMSAYENTNACKIFKLSNKASKCLSSSKTTRYLYFRYVGIQKLDQILPSFDPQTSSGQL